MRDRLTRWKFAALCACALSAPSVNATSIDYMLTDLGSDSWRYDFTIDNSPAAPAFDEFTIYFSSDKYSSLVLLASPANWDPLLIQPDSSIPADGFFDALNTVGPMADGEAASGFAISFSYLAGLRPDGQPFDLIDSSSFQVVFSGSTETVGAVPEPQSYLTLALGLALIAAVRTRQSPARQR